MRFATSMKPGAVINGSAVLRWVGSDREPCGARNREPVSEGRDLAVDVVGRLEAGHVCAGRVGLSSRGRGARRATVWLHSAAVQTDVRVPRFAPR